MSNFLRRLGSSSRRDDSSSSNAIRINSQQQSTNNNQELMKSINTQEINMAKIDQHLHNWNIPLVKKDTIYQIGSFEFMLDYSIKTTEDTIMITEERVEEIQLLSEEAIHKHRQNNYKFLHIGLVQVAVKPLFRLGQNIPILVILRDARNLNFNNSLLAVLNSNLESGLVYFDCYPNFTVGLHDPTILSALTINLKASNLTYQDKAQPVALIYRIYYKVMNTTISPRAIRMSPPGHTVIMEADKTKHKTFTPKRLAWDEIIKQTDWKLEKLCPPKPLHGQNES